MGGYAGRGENPVRVPGKCEEACRGKVGVSADSPQNTTNSDAH